MHEEMQCFFEKIDLIFAAYTKAVDIVEEKTTNKIEGNHFYISTKYRKI